MDFHQRIANLNRRLTAMARVKQIQALKERLRDKDFDSMREFLHIKNEIARLQKMIPASAQEMAEKEVEIKNKRDINRLNELLDIRETRRLKPFERKELFNLQQNFRVASGPDVHMARDIVLSLTNDGRFYPRLTAMLGGIAKHMAKGQYSEGGALKQCVNIINAYLPIYKKNSGAPHMRVDNATKSIAAKELLEDSMESIQEMAENNRAMKRNASADPNIGDLQWCTLANGKKLGFRYLVGGEGVRLGFQYGNGAYNHYSSLENFTECYKAMKRDGAFQPLGKNYQGPMCTINLPNGKKFSIQLLCSIDSECRLGFQCGNGAYWAYDTLKNFTDCAKQNFY